MQIHSSKTNDPNAKEASRQPALESGASTFGAPAFRLNTGEEEQLDKKSAEGAGPLSASGDGSAGDKNSTAFSLNATPVQAKLSVGAPDDLFEKEADEVAEQVMAHMGTPAIQPKNEETKIQTKPVFQLKAGNIGGAGQMEVSDEVQQGIHSARGQGSTLPGGLRDQMESAFGADFGDVKIHQNEQADTLNRSLNARAFTTGQDIFFKQGEYNPNSSDGQKLLAHELTHVVQQGSGRVSRKLIQREGDGKKPAEATAVPPVSFNIYRPAYEPAAKEMATELKLQGSAEEFVILVMNSVGARVFDQNATALSPDTFTFKEPQIFTDGVFISDIDSNLFYRVMSHADFSLNSDSSPAAVVKLKTSDIEPQKKEEGDKKPPEQKVTMIGSLFVREADFAKLFTKKTRVIIIVPSAIPGAKPPQSYASASDKEYEGNASKANAPGFPAHMDGLSSLPVGADGNFNVSLDYSVAGLNVISMTLAAMNHVNYHWEIYDITDMATQVGGKERAEEQLRLKPKIGEPGADPAGKEVVTGDLVSHDARRRVANFEEDVSDSAKRSVQAYKEGKYSKGLMNLMTLRPAMLTASVLAQAGGFLLRSLVDSFGAYSDARAIPFEKEGIFLIRCFAQPCTEETKKGIEVRRAASVAVKIVDVSTMEKVSKESLDATDSQVLEIALGVYLCLKTEKNISDARKKELGKQLAEAQVMYGSDIHEQIEARIKAKEDEKTKLANTEADTQRKTEIDKSIATLREADGELANLLKLYSGDTPTDMSAIGLITLTIEKKKAELENSKANLVKTKRLKAELEDLEERLELAKSWHLSTDKVKKRPQASLTSEETGQTYPLILQLGKMTSSDGEVHVLLSDVTSKNGRPYEGVAANYSDAVKDAFKQMADDCEYGRGRLYVKIPKEYTEYSGGNIELDCKPREEALVKQRLEDLVMVLVALGLFVPELSLIAGIIGAALAAYNLYTRWKEHRLRPDIEMVNDLVSVIGVVAQGVSLIGKFSAVQRGGKFYLIAIDKIAKGAAATSKGLDEFGFLMGETKVLYDLVEIMKQESSHSITPSEARRRRVELMFQFIKDGGIKIYGHLKSEQKDWGKALSDEEAKSKTTKEKQADPHETQAPKSAEDAHTKPKSADTETPVAAAANAKKQQSASKSNDQPPPSNPDGGAKLSKPLDVVAKSGTVAGGRLFDVELQGAGDTTLPVVLILFPKKKEASMKARYEAAKAAEATGYGPPVHGFVDTGKPDYVAFAVGMPKGGEIQSNPNASKKERTAAEQQKGKVNLATAKDIADYSRKLLDLGYYYDGPLKGVVDNDGHFQPTEFGNIKKLPEVNSEGSVAQEASQQASREAAMNTHLKNTADEVARIKALAESNAAKALEKTPGDAPKTATGGKGAGGGGKDNVPPVASGGEEKGETPKKHPAFENLPENASKQPAPQAMEAFQKAMESTDSLPASAAEDLIVAQGDWKGKLKKIPKTLGDHAGAAEKALVDARERIVDRIFAQVKAVFPGVEKFNVGTKALSSDIDITIKPIEEGKNADPAKARPLHEQLREASEAALYFSELLRRAGAGGETDIVFDTNIYAYIGENNVKPRSEAEAGARSQIHKEVGLAEQIRGQGKQKFQAFKEKTLREMARSDRPEVVAAHKEMQQTLANAEEFYKKRNTERAAAEKQAKKENPGDAANVIARKARENILRQKREELAKYAQQSPPDLLSMQRLQAEILWFEPDAYAARPAIDLALGGQERRGAGIAAAKKRLEKQKAFQEKQVKALEARGIDKLSMDEKEQLEEYRKNIEDATTQLSDDSKVIVTTEEVLNELRAIDEREKARGAQPGDAKNKLGDSAAAASSNLGMIEEHVAHATELDDKVKKAAKYGARIIVSILASNESMGMPDKATQKMLDMFTESRWPIWSDTDVPKQLMDGMLERFAKVFPERVTFGLDGKPKPDSLKRAFVEHILNTARNAAQRLHITEAMMQSGKAGANSGTPDPPAAPKTTVPLVVKEGNRFVSFDDPANKRFQATGALDDGILTLTIRTVDGEARSTAIVGSDAFQQIVKHFGSQVKAIKGSWSYDTNITKFNELVKAGASSEKAASQTWSGEQAKIAGFPYVTIVKMEGSHGNFEKVEVHFTRQPAGESDEAPPTRRE